MGKSENIYYVYILYSEKDGKHYTCYTHNLNLRFEQHQNGEVESTKHRRPLMLIYFEACLNQEDALKREKYYKEGYLAAKYPEKQEMDLNHRLY